MRADPLWNRPNPQIAGTEGDATVVPLVAELMSPFGQLLAEATETLLRGRGLRGRSRDRARAAIGHALAFPAWQDLTAAQGLDDDEARELMARLITAAG